MLFLSPDGEMVMFPEVQWIGIAGLTDQIGFWPDWRRDAPGEITMTARAKNQLEQHR
jgi:hypothetical protein